MLAHRPLEVPTRSIRCLRRDAAPPARGAPEGRLEAVAGARAARPVRADGPRGDWRRRWHDHRPLERRRRLGFGFGPALRPQARAARLPRRALRPPVQCLLDLCWLRRLLDGFCFRHWLGLLFRGLGLLHRLPAPLRRPGSASLGLLAGFVLRLRPPRRPLWGFASSGFASSAGCTIGVSTVAAATGGLWLPRRCRLRLHFLFFLRAPLPKRAFSGDVARARARTSSAALSPARLPVPQPPPLPPPPAPGSTSRSGSGSASTSSRWETAPPPRGNLLSAAGGGFLDRRRRSLLDGRSGTGRGCSRLSRRRQHVVRKRLFGLRKQRRSRRHRRAPSCRPERQRRGGLDLGLLAQPSCGGPGPSSGRAWTQPTRQPRSAATPCHGDDDAPRCSDRRARPRPRPRRGTSPRSRILARVARASPYPGLFGVLVGRLGRRRLRRRDRRRGPSRCAALRRSAEPRRDLPDASTIDLTT